MRQAKRRCRQLDDHKGGRSVSAPGAVEEAIIKPLGDIVASELRGPDLQPDPNGGNSISVCINGQHSGTEATGTFSSLQALRLGGVLAALLQGHARKTIWHMGAINVSLAQRLKILVPNSIQFMSGELHELATLSNAFRIKFPECSLAVAERPGEVDGAICSSCDFLFLPGLTLPPGTHRPLDLAIGQFQFLDAKSARAQIHQAHTLNCLFLLTSTLGREGVRNSPESVVEIVSELYWPHLMPTTSGMSFGANTTRMRYAETAPVHQPRRQYIVGWRKLLP